MSTFAEAAAWLLAFLILWCGFAVIVALFVGWLLRRFPPR